MAIAAGSYGSVAEVLAYTRHLLTSGAPTFGPDTRPTLAEVERFIDRRSSLLNACLAEYGYTVPVAGPQAAVDILAYFVTQGAAADAEMTARAAGSSAEGGEDRRERMFLAEFGRACAFIASAAFASLGAPQARPSSAIAGIAFGGRTRTGRPLRPVFGRTAFGQTPTTESPTREPGYPEE